MLKKDNAVLTKFNGVLLPGFVKSVGAKIKVVFLDAQRTSKYCTTYTGTIPETQLKFVADRAYCGPEQFKTMRFKKVQSISMRGENYLCADVWMGNTKIAAYEERYGNGRLLPFGTSDAEIKAYNSLVAQIQDYIRPNYNSIEVFMDYMIFENSKLMTYEEHAQILKKELEKQKGPTLVFCNPNKK
jgi:hypothetical protein